ncbi:MAG: DUF192 domain-containing protein [Candidatus Hadarchaeum sp.]|uniref:DUF192 domain-containing protein n=1 Tax=Candidatus Hadarchaeum sp. TaxID=2883567 RepID=UPI003D0D555D
MPTRDNGFRLVDRTTRATIARRVMLANSFFSRLRGLMFRKSLLPGEALFFIFARPGRNSVHMFFVRFPIDLIYLDAGFRVVEVRNSLRPWRFHRSRVVSSYLIELPAGTVSRLEVSLGHEIRLEKGF